MGHTACREPQCLYDGALCLYSVYRLQLEPGCSQYVVAVLLSPWLVEQRLMSEVVCVGCDGGLFRMCWYLQLKWFVHKYLNITELTGLPSSHIISIKTICWTLFCVTDILWMIIILCKPNSKYSSLNVSEWGSSGRIFFNMVMNCWVLQNNQTSWPTKWSWTSHCPFI
jgi:hypothetical protein